MTQHDVESGARRVVCGPRRIEATYEEIKLLGRGSFGAARLVKCRRTGKRLVSKEIKLDALSGSEREKARGEAELLRRCSSHSNIVTYIESFMQAPERRGRGSGACSLFIVMDYCDGGDLDQLVKDKKNSGRRFSENEAMAIFVQLELALQHVHAHRILHRDIKAGNIFMTRAGVVKLGDFGIAKALGEDSVARTRIGTPYYLAPEICHGRPYGRSADMWALGVVLYLMLAMRLPYEAKSMAELVKKVTDESRRPPALSERHLSADVRALSASLLRHDARRRPSADALASSPLTQSHLARLGELIETQRAAVQLEKRERIDAARTRRRDRQRQQQPSSSQSHQQQQQREQQHLTRQRQGQQKQMQQALEERPPWRALITQPAERDEVHDSESKPGRGKPGKTTQGITATSRRPQSRPGISALRRDGGFDGDFRPTSKDAPVRALPGMSSARAGHGEHSCDKATAAAAAPLPVNPFSREAMKRGVDWASSRSGRMQTHAQARGHPQPQPQSQPQSAVSPPRQARHAQMVAESRAREAALSDAARREYFETRRAAQRNKLEVQRNEASDAATAAASCNTGHPHRVRVNPRVHREWWGEVGANDRGDGEALVVAAPSKAELVRQRARQRAAEAAERRREELRAAAQAQFKELRQVRERVSQHPATPLRAIVPTSAAIDSTSQPKSKSPGSDPWEQAMDKAELTHPCARPDMDIKSGKISKASSPARVRAVAEAKTAHNSLEVSTHIEIDEGDNGELAELFALGSTIDKALRTELDSGVLESERDDIKQ